MAPPGNSSTLRPELAPLIADIQSRGLVVEQTGETTRVGGAGPSDAGMISIASKYDPIMPKVTDSASGTNKNFAIPVRKITGRLFFTAGEDRSFFSASTPVPKPGIWMSEMTRARFMPSA